jgi:hypothetical protein
MSVVVHPAFSGHPVGNRFGASIERLVLGNKYEFFIENKVAYRADLTVRAVVGKLPF